MNLAYVRRVLSAHRAIVVLALVASVGAALFVYARPGWDGGPTMKARTPEVWRSSSVLSLTQEGFPWGRVNPSAGDENRFSSLAVLYAELATSDQVLAIANGGKRFNGDISAEPVTYNIGGFSAPVVLPMVRMTVTAPTGAAATSEAGRVARALQQYVASGQANAKIGKRQRVLIQPARSSAAPQLVSGPSKVVPMVVFVLCLGLALMAVFGYHNYRFNAAEDELPERLRSVGRPDAATAASRSRQPSRMPSPSASGEQQSDQLRARSPRPRAVLPASPARPDGRGEMPVARPPSRAKPSSAEQS